MDIFVIIVLLVIGVVIVLYTYLMLAVLHGTYYGVPYVPTNFKTCKNMIKMAGIKKGDKVYDLGCGDGRLVFAAADEGADAVGVEISILLVYMAKLAKYLLKKKGKIIKGTLWDMDLSDADVVFCYLLPKEMENIQRKFEKELKDECKVVSHAFPLPGWKVIKELPYNRKNHRGSVWVQVKN